MVQKNMMYSCNVLVFNIYSYNNPILRCISVVIECMAKGLFGLERIGEEVSWGSERAAQLSELFYDAAFKAWGCLNSPDYEMTIPEQNEYNTAPPSTDTEQQSLAGSLTSQSSSPATKSRKTKTKKNLDDT